MASLIYIASSRLVSNTMSDLSLKGVGTRIPAVWLSRYKFLQSNLETRVLLESENWLLQILLWPHMFHSMTGHHNKCSKILKKTRKNCNHVTITCLTYFHLSSTIWSDTVMNFQMWIVSMFFLNIYHYTTKRWSRVFFVTVYYKIRTTFL